MSSTTTSNIFQSPSTAKKHKKKKKKADARPLSTLGRQDPAAQSLPSSSSARALDQRTVNPTTLPGRPPSCSPLPPTGASTAGVLHRAPSATAINSTSGATINPPTLPGCPRSLSPLPFNGALTHQTTLPPNGASTTAGVMLGQISTTAGVIMEPTAGVIIEQPALTPAIAERCVICLAQLLPMRRCVICLAQLLPMTFLKRFP
jgi:hypothetical protein